MRPATPIEIYVKICGMSQEFELWIRLYNERIVGRDEALSMRLEDAINKLFDSNTVPDNGWRKQCHNLRKLRNKIVHCEFDAARQILKEMGVDCSDCKGSALEFELVPGALERAKEHQIHLDAMQSICADGLFAHVANAFEWANWNLSRNYKFMMKEAYSEIDLESLSRGPENISGAYSRVKGTNIFRKCVKK